MDWSLVIFIVIILLFTWRGYRNGFVRSLGRVLSLVAGYAAAILFGAPLAPWVAVQFEWLGVLAYLATAVTLFFAASLSVDAIFRLLRRHLFPDDKISTASAFGGGLIGALVGGLVAFLVVWTINLFHELSPAASAGTAALEPSSKVEVLANRLASGAVTAALSATSAPPEVARLGGELVARPVEVTQHAQQLTNSTEFQVLIRDPHNQQVLNRGNAEQVQDLPAFQALASNPDLLALAGMAGMADGDDIEADLARMLTDNWRRAQRVKNHPRVQEIFADPRFRDALLSENPIALLTNPQLLELADILYADDGYTDSVAAKDSTQASATVPAQKIPDKIYKWTDANGRVHYSNQKPEN